MLYSFFYEIKKLSKKEIFIIFFIFVSWLLLLCSVGSNSSELITDIIKRNFHNVENIKLFKFSYFRSGAVLVIFFNFIDLII